MKKLLLLLLLIAGCAGEPCRHYDRLQAAYFGGAGPAPKRPYGSVVPIYHASDVKRPYTVVGFMTCQGGVGEEAGILKAMLYRAADMGADAVLLDGKRISQEVTAKPSENINVKWGWMTLIGNGNTVAFRSQAIRYNSP